MRGAQNDKVAVILARASLAHADKIPDDPALRTTRGPRIGITQTSAATVNGLYKADCIRTTVFHTGPYKTITDVEYATTGWVDWYNYRRLQGSLGMVSPDEYEADYYAALDREPHPA